MNSSATDQPRQPAGYRRWLIRLALFLGLPVLFYYGYCWGLWGRGSLLLQYLFQCNCSPTSEEARYSEEVDIIVSACKYQRSILSPSGRLIYVLEEEAGIISSYLLNLESGEKAPFVPPDGSNYFLNDELIFYSYYGNDGNVLDIKTGTKYPIKRFTRGRSDAFSNNEMNLMILAEELRNAEEIYLVDNDFVIALAPDFRTFPEHNFFTGWFDFPGSDPDALQRFLQENEITYRLIPDQFPSELVSPDGRFIASADGIFSLETGHKIVEGYSARGLFHPYSGKNFSVRGWTYDSTGAIYSKFLNPCLVEASFFLSDEPGCFFEVPQPLLKLRVPDEYLLPTPVP
jgi:hypothetical protein